MLLSKLLRAATLLGRDTQEVIAEYLETHRGELPSLVPQQGMDSLGPLSSNPLAAAAAGHGLMDIDSKVGSRSLGRHDEKEQSQFIQAEQQYLSRLQTLKEEVEVHLPVERAQTIIRCCFGSRWLTGSIARSLCLAAQGMSVLIATHVFVLLHPAQLAAYKPNGCLVYLQEQAAAAGVEDGGDGPLAGRGCGLHAGHAAA